MDIDSVGNDEGGGREVLQMAEMERLALPLPRL